MTPRKEVMIKIDSRRLMQFPEEVKEEHEARALLEGNAEECE